MKNESALPSAHFPWIMLIVRTLLFFFFQALIALVFLLRGGSTPWITSSGWWPVTASLGSLVVIALLVNLFRREGKRYGDLFRINRETLGKDLLALLGIFIIMGPVAFLPNILLARGLFGDQQIALDMLIHPLPLWAVIVSLTLFPLSIALSELPCYFAYVMPRLEAKTGKPLLAGGLIAFWLAAQHIALPFLPDGRFILWRLGMFLPFAILLALVLRWRPRLLPYLVIIHGLMDLSTGILVLFASR